MNGWITIGTKIDTKGLERDLKESEKKLRQYEREAEKLTKQKIKAEADLEELRTAEEAVKMMTDKSLEYAQSQKEVEAILKDEADQLQMFRAGYEGQLKEIQQIDGALQKNKDLQTGIKQQIDEQAQSLSKTKKANEMKGILNGINTTIKDNIKSMLRWGLAIFGIRSAYNFLRNSISTISQYNDQVASDIEYIRFALASTLEPVVLRLISLVKTLLGYIGYIAKQWFNVDLFAGASVDKFKQNEKALGGATKQAKELNKQLAGFDEMNVIQDTSSAGGGAGAGGGGTLPSFDLSSMQGDVPQWLKWIVDNKDLILSVLFGIGAGLLAVQFGLTGIQALGIGVAVAGLVYAIQALIDYLKDPSFENFGKIIQGIGVFVVGLGIAFLGLPAIIVGVVVLIVGTIIKYWDEIKAFLLKGVEWLEGSIDAVRDFFGDQVADIFETCVTAFKGIILGIDEAIKGVKLIFDGLIQFITGIFTGNWKKAINGLVNIFAGIFQTIVGVVQSVFSLIAGLAVSIAKTVGYTIAGAFKAVVNGILGAIEGILNTPIKAVNSLIKTINKVPGINLGTLSTFKLPRLAKGGIINMPGRGVPVGSAIGGERGAEGVIPLTDSQQMALLGEAIGRYITINANITNTMNGRVISRELQKVQNDSDFAFNK